MWHCLQFKFKENTSEKIHIVTFKRKGVLLFLVHKSIIFKLLQLNPIFTNCSNTCVWQYLQLSHQLLTLFVKESLFLPGNENLLKGNTHDRAVQQSSLPLSIFGSASKSKDIKRHATHSYLK